MLLFIQIDALPHERTFETGNDKLVHDDQPGSPLDPADYSRAREYKEEPIPDTMEDPILIAGGWEGDIDNVDTSKLQTLLDVVKPKNAINNNAMLWPGDNFLTITSAVLKLCQFPEKGRQTMKMRFFVNLTK